MFSVQVESSGFKVARKRLKHNLNKIIKTQALFVDHETLNLWVNID